MAVRPFEWKYKEEIDAIMERGEAPKMYLATVQRVITYRVVVEGYSELGAAGEAEDTCETMWEEWEKEDEPANLQTIRTVHVIPLEQA